MTIEEVLKKKEGQTFDRKSISIEPKALEISITAFANADGGDIAIGISDKTRRIEGVDRMCKELDAVGLQDPKYYSNSFILQTIIYNATTEKGIKTTLESCM